MAQVVAVSLAWTNENTYMKVTDLIARVYLYPQGEKQRRRDLNGCNGAAQVGCAAKWMLLSLLNLCVVVVVKKIQKKRTANFGNDEVH